MRPTFFNAVAVRAIIRREYVTRVRTKSFILMTILVPTFMAGSILLPAVLRRSEHPVQRRIALADGTGLLADSVEAALDERLSDGRPRYVFARVPADSAGIRDAEQLVRMDAYDALLVIPNTVFEGGQATLSVSGTPGFADMRRVETALTNQVIALRLWREGLDAKRVGKLMERVRVNAISLGSEGGGASAQAALFGAVVMAMLMYMTLMLYGGWTMQGVLRDKTSRVVEILVSTTRPTELMFGKIVGIGSVGLTQISIWLAALVVAGMVAPTSTLGQYLDVLRGLSLVAFLLFYVTGYLLFATLYAGVGALCSSPDDAQQLLWPVALLLMVPIFLVGPAIEDPGGRLVTALSFVPYFSPVLMLLRVVTARAGPGEVAASLAINGATIVVTAWLVGKVFRVGILMTGKRPSLPEVWRWMRQA